MKKNKIILAVLLFVQFIGFTSCDDWLDLYPEDSVPKDFYWKTKEDVSSAMTGIYCSALSDVNYLFIWGESRADMWQNGKTAYLVNLNAIRMGEISSSNSFCQWGSCYNTINNCNILLKYAGDAKENDNSFTEESLRAYEAQAVAMRSLIFFYLTRTFGDIPLPLDAYVDDANTLSIGKTSQTEVLDSLAAQLERICISNAIPYSYSSVEQNKGYITRYAVDALLADIYLWQGEYEKCVKVCDEILNSGQYALIPVAKEMETLDDGTIVYHPNSSGVSEMFDKLYRQGNSVESIFELQFAKDVTLPFYEAMSPRTINYMIPNVEHINSEIFPGTKTGDSSYEDVRKLMNSKNGYIWKYVGVSYDSDISLTEEEMTNNYIIYRLADVYLMKAEALVQLGKLDRNQATLTEALNLIDIVRDRANAVETTDIDRLSSTLNAGILEQFILDERARELMFEGKRWFDVLRNARRNNYENINFLTAIVPYSTSADKVFSILVKYRDYNSHYMPIPQRDVDANPLLTQNPFYDTNSKK